MKTIELISHDDRTLKEHLLGLKDVVDYLIKEKSQNLFSKDFLANILHNLVSYHDLAKASRYFQVYLIEALILKESGHKYYSTDQLKAYLDANKDILKELIFSPELKSHAHFGAWAFLASIEKEKRYSIESLLLMKILKRHHGFLRNFELGNINPKDYVEIFEKVGKTIDFEKFANIADEIGLPFVIPDINQILADFKILDFKKIEISLNRSSDPSYYFKTLFLYSLLLSADKGDVMLKEKNFLRSNIPSSIIDDFKGNSLTSNFSINELRELAYNTAVENAIAYGTEHFFSITLPTGLGKTFTALKTAFLVKEEYSPDFRIIYCLPFTSIIDQNASVLQEIFRFGGLNLNGIGIHHHLAIPENREENEFDYPQWEYHTEGWQNEVTVTTFIQFWESVFTNQNRQIRKFHNLANSIIILDEVQSIPANLLPALEFMMEGLSRFFNTKFILVTATQPILLPGKTRELCFKNGEDFFFKSMNRTALNKELLNIGEISEDILADIITDEYSQNVKSTLVICNTIRYSQNLYQKLKTNLPSVNIFYLSASIIPYSREKLLREQIIPSLKTKEPIILISTQVIEAGVDVDFDLVYRDFAPLSSINQSAGRCNRNSTQGISEVKLFKSGKTKIYDPTLLSVTEDTLSAFDSIIEERNYFELNKRYFLGVKSRIQDNSSVSQDLIRSINRLKFDDIGSKKEFRLIVEKYKSYNFFIPVSDDAEKTWNSYMEILNIENHFEKKQKLKVLFPKMMKYVIKIPEYVRTVTNEDKEKVIIYDSDWQSFYDLDFGYKKPEKESPIEIF
jgi:CRISPR-associated endonuclease/helicase Cas3